MAKPMRLVRAKAEAAIAAGLIAIVCVGETEVERDAGRAVAVVEGQLDGSVPPDRHRCPDRRRL